MKDEVGVATNEPAAILGGQVRFLRVPVVSDPRGSLMPLDFSRLPFVPCRFFVVTGVPAGTVRGGHALTRGWQLLVCLSGQIDVRVRRPGEEQVVTLTAGSGGLLIASMVWAEQTYREPGSTLLVLASEPYDPSTYVRSCS